MSTGQDATTPYRETFLSVDVPEKTQRYPPQDFSRKAADMGKGKTAAALPTQNVWLAGEGEAWLLSPFFREKVQGVQYDNQQLTPSGSTVKNTNIRLADVNTVPSMREVPTFRPNTDLPGSGTTTGPGGVVTSGFYAFQRLVPAPTADWHEELSADLAALPKPDESDEAPQVMPLDRVISGNVGADCTPNCAFLLLFSVPQNWSGSDCFLRFYFGGPTDVIPPSAGGGQFCVSLRGGGGARLYEFDDHDPDARTWIRRDEFEWSGPDMPGLRIGMLGIVPFGTNRLLFYSPSNPTFTPRSAAIAGPLIGIASAFLAVSTVGSQHLFRDNPIAEAGSASQHLHTTSATGHGIIRADMPRTARPRLTILRVKYPTLGRLTDGPFQFDIPLPVGTPLTLRASTNIPLNTGISEDLYDANTNTVLATDSQGRFLSTVAQCYYPVFSFQSVDNTQSPALFGYSVHAPGDFVVSNPTPVMSIKELTDVQVTGPDVAADHEGAHLQLKDTFGRFTALIGIRDRIHTFLSVRDTRTGALVSHLFEGETSEAHLTQRGVNHFAGSAGQGAPAYPSSAWKDHDLPLVGLWARLADQVAIDLKNFHADPNAAPGLDGYPVPWKVTDIIHYLLNAAGFPDEEIDVPDIDLRLFSTADRTAEYVMLPGTGYTTMLQRLSLDYLQSILLRDPNAGAFGMWRLIPNPRPPFTNIVAHYVFGPVVTGLPVLATHPGAYPANTTFILRDTYKPFRRAPEMNFITVSGIGAMFPGPAGSPVRLTQAMYNPDSFWFDATQPAPPETNNPDLLRRWVAGFLFDASLGTQEAVDWATRTIYDRTAHGQHWHLFHAPLLFITDPLDLKQVRPRVPRVNDLITVNGTICVVRSCNPSYRSDKNQFCAIEALELTTAN